MENQPRFFDYLCPHEHTQEASTPISAAGLSLPQPAQGRPVGSRPETALSLGRDHAFGQQHASLVTRHCTGVKSGHWAASQLSVKCYLNSYLALFFLRANRFSRAREKDKKKSGSIIRIFPEIQALLVPNVR